MHQATYDTLTNIPNRSLLLNSIERGIINSKKNDRYMALLLIDLDRFSQINDLLGRSKGDQLLKEFVSRCKTVLRSSEMFGRIGGDEFLIILDGLKDKNIIGSVINSLLKSFVEPYSIMGNLVPLSACIGISVFPQNGADADALLSNADIAMLRAKKEGRGGISVPFI